MSDPLAWNGTTFKRPKFWTGTEWKEYLPAVYDTEVCWDGFETGWDTWSSSDQAPEWIGGEGGYIRAWGYDTFIGGSVGFRRASYRTELFGQGGHQVRCDLTYRAWPHPESGGQRQFIGSSYVSLSYAYPGGGVELGVKDFDGISDAQWRTVSSEVKTLPGGGYKGQAVDLTASVELNLSALGGGYPSTYMDLASFTIIDLTTGTPLYGLGFPGWEPKVYRTDGTWK